MEMRADRVAEVIQAPSVKDSTAEKMMQAINSGRSDDAQDQMRRAELTKQSQLENYARTL